jgi:ribosomal-protein-alanine N-acetyltransferase
VIGSATIVPLTEEHLAALMRYEREMFGTEAWSAGTYRAELADTGRRHYVAAEDASGQLLGWAGIMVIGDAAEILTVGVVPTARRRGIAVQMLAEMRAEARRRGAREIFLEVRVDNEPALTLYEREGFARVGLRVGYYDHGRVDAVIMHRVL